MKNKHEIRKSAEEWKNFTEEDFKKELADFFNTPEMKVEVEQNMAFMNQIQPYLHMTKEEMEKVIPDGAYEVGGSTMVMWTGKGGFIMTILAMQKELKIFGK